LTKSKKYERKKVGTLLAYKNKLHLNDLFCSNLLTVDYIFSIIKEYQIGQGTTNGCSVACQVKSF